METLPRRTVIAGLLAMSAGGCNVVHARMDDPAPPAGPSGEPMALIPGYDAQIRSYGSGPPLPPSDDPLSRAVAARLGGDAPLDLLALSGGGDDGAYGAGFLRGWTEHGSRPEFDIVTGVSTGAMIAPMAFLGPAHDAQLEVFYTRTPADAIYSLRLLDLLTGGLAAADTAPLARLISQQVTPALVARLAGERRLGRLLLIGTTDLDAQRQVIWDIGRIAASAQPDRVQLIRRVILASAAIPGAFPPVGFTVTRAGKTWTELHVDGGITRGVFAYPRDLRLPPPRGPRNMWVIRNAKLGPVWTATRSTAVGIASRSLSTLLKSQSRGDIGEIQAIAREGGFDLHLTAVPPDFPLNDQKPFDPTYMRTLYATGRAAGRSGRGWGTMAELTGLAG